MMFVLIDNATKLSDGFVDCAEEDIQDCTPDGFTAFSVEDESNMGLYRLDTNDPLSPPILIYVGYPPTDDGYWEYDSISWEWRDTRSEYETPEFLWEFIRIQRDEMLFNCDWTQLDDIPAATKAAWANYRQQLRDVTLQPDPFNIVWPVAPG